MSVRRMGRHARFLVAYHDCGILIQHGYGQVGGDEVVVVLLVRQRERELVARVKLCAHGDGSAVEQDPAFLLLQARNGARGKAKRIL